MAKTTTGKLIQEYFQAAAETVEGTTNTNANFSTIGALPTQKLGFKKIKDSTDERQIGDEDILAHVPGTNKYNILTDVFLESSAYTKRLVNSANPTTPAGTVSEPLTQFYSYLLDGTKYYRIFKGCRPMSGSIKGEINKAHITNISWVGKSSALPATSHGFAGTPTIVATKPAGPIWHWQSGGATPIAVNAVNVDGVSINVNFNRGTKEDHTFGNEDPHSSQPYDREITYTIECLYSTTAIETLWDSEAEFTIAWILKSAVSTLTLSNCDIKEYYTTDIVANGQEVIKEHFTGSAKTANLT